MARLAVLFLIIGALPVLCARSSLCASRLDRADATRGWATYTGAYFTAKYPPGFKPRGSLRPSVSPAPPGSEPYESAFFASPDGLVEFYVFSPQWDGEPTDIILRPETEELVATRTETKEWPYCKDAAGRDMVLRTRATWVTIKAKDGSYTRSYVDIRHVYAYVGESDDYIISRRTFGFKYASRTAYNRYRDRYLSFQQSLCQYAD